MQKNYTPTRIVTRLEVYDRKRNKIDNIYDYF